MVLPKPGGTERLLHPLTLALKQIRLKSRWTVVGVAVVVAVAAPVSVALAAAGGGSRLTAAGSAATGAGQSSPVGAAAAVSQASSAGSASPSPSPSPSPSAAPPLGFYTLNSVSYTSTGPGGGLDGPQGIAVSSNGAVYVSNTAANVVSTIVNGKTTVLAGKLTGYGEHGDGGPATSATLFHPAGLAVDAKGDVFIADTGDNVIREVTPDGIIHRFAGTGAAGRALIAGRATLSQLNHPQAVAVAPDGDVLIADTYNNRVLSVTPAGKITVVAGTGRAGYKGDNGPATLAELNQPAGVAVDARGDIYIADTSNNVIREVSASTGIITTVAGDYAADKASDGLGAFTGDDGPATSAQLNGPQGIAVDSAGDLLIADTFNSVIRGVNPDGIISTVGQVDTPDAVAADPAGTSMQFWTAGSAGISVSGALVPPVPYGTPVIDGQQDAIWDQSPVDHLSSSSSAITADVRLMWDDSYLYVLAVVSDSTPVAPVTSTGYPGNAGIGNYDDGVDVWINWSNSPDALYTNTSPPFAEDYVFVRNGVVGTNFPDVSGSGLICPTGDVCSLGGIGDPSTVKSDVVSTSTGYTVEAAIPWPAGVNPHPGADVGFAADANDFTVAGQPRTSYITSESATQYWLTPVGLPFVVLGPQ